jgi:isoleucyl-tRNA synthetase
MKKDEQVEEVKQSERITKLPDGRFQLLVDNYGNNKDHQLTQVYSKEDLKKQYENMKNTLHHNSQELAKFKISKDKYPPEEREELEKFGLMMQKLQGFNAFIQQEAQTQSMLEQQEAIRRGLTDIEVLIPELKRKK